VLRETARPFDLPAEATTAENVLGELRVAMQRIGQAHQFSKGMGDTRGAADQDRSRCSPRE
jgi:hypothetical protein